MDQISFSEVEYNLKKRKTRREKILEQMDQLIPWKQLEKKIQKHYPTAGNGRRPYPLPVMLRIHCMQLFSNLSDPLIEDSLYEIESMRRFAGLSLSDALPDESTILNFRHLIERHDLGKSIFKIVNKNLEKQRLLLREGSIVDATIISAPTSTKNKAGKRDPEMHQTKKGNEWKFGMKMHIGVDDTNGTIHSISTTSANQHDITQTKKLLHGKEEICWGDAGYVGVEKRAEFSDTDIEWMIAVRPGVRKNLTGCAALLEYRKAQIRSKVEHPFRYIKQQFGYSKVRYRGLAKNTNRLHVLVAFTNLLISKRHLLT